MGRCKRTGLRRSAIKAPCVHLGVRSDLDYGYDFPAPSHGPLSRRRAVSQSDVLKGFPEWPTGDFNEEPFHWYYLSRNRRRDGKSQARALSAIGATFLSILRAPRCAAFTQISGSLQARVRREDFDIKNVQRCRASARNSNGAKAPYAKDFR